jgi:hypothetical protein
VLGRVLVDSTVTNFPVTLDRPTVIVRVLAILDTSFPPRRGRRT